MAGAGLFFLRTEVVEAMKRKGSFIQTGICTSLSNHKLVTEAGYPYIEESVQSFLDPLNEEAAFITKLDQARSAGITIPACNVFLPGKLKSVGPDAVHDEILDYAETAFSRAKMAGVGIIVFGSGASRSIPDGFPQEKAREQFIELCRRMGPLARRQGITVVLEPLNSGECNFLNSVAEGGEMVKEINHPNIRLLADIFHMLREKEGPESILRYGKYIKHTHIAENRDRSAPGVNGEDFTPYIKALFDINYKGMLSVECSWKDINKEAGPALVYLRQQIAASEAL
jgi:sugar phosphate isomerase/epimerase